MMGTVQQAAQVANALGAVSPQFKAVKSYTHYGSFGIATGFIGYMAGASMTSKNMAPMLRLSNWGVIGGMVVLSFLTRNKGDQ